MGKRLGRLGIYQTSDMVHLSEIFQVYWLNPVKRVCIDNLEQIGDRKEGQIPKIFKKRDSEGCGFLNRGPSAELNQR